MKPGQAIGAKSHNKNAWHLLHTDTGNFGQLINAVFGHFTLLLVAEWTHMETTHRMVPKYTENLHTVATIADVGQE